MADYEHDIFISYRRMDEEWIHWTRNNFLRPLRSLLRPALGNVGIFVDDQIETGASWPARLARALARSRLLALRGRAHCSSYTFITTPVIDNGCSQLYCTITKRTGAMDISLTSQLEKVVKEKVASGLYNSASEVVGEALRLLDDYDRLQQIKLERLRHDIQEGLDSGEFAPLDIKEIKAEARNRRRLAQNKPRARR